MSTLHETVAAADAIESLLMVLKADSRYAHDSSALRARVYASQTKLNSLRGELMLMLEDIRPPADG